MEMYGVGLLRDVYVGVEVMVGGVGLPTLFMRYLAILS
jgi:hypothetical protein